MDVASKDGAENGLDIRQLTLSPWKMLGTETLALPVEMLVSGTANGLADPVQGRDSKSSYFARTQ